VEDSSTDFTDRIRQPLRPEAPPNYPRAAAASSGDQQSGYQRPSDSAPMAPQVGGAQVQQRSPVSPPGVRPYQRGSPLLSESPDRQQRASGSPLAPEVPNYQRGSGAGMQPESPSFQRSSSAVMNLEPPDIPEDRGSVAMDVQRFGRQGASEFRTYDPFG
jgi:hypothetical protein